MVLLIVFSRLRKFEMSMYPYMGGPYPSYPMPIMQDGAKMLYVGDLPNDITQEELEGLFEKYGDCTVKLIRYLSKPIPIYSFSELKLKESSMPWSLLKISKKVKIHSFFLLLFLNSL